ncbi:MAG TPA: hypothetical protein VH679_15110 [Vicinamibacterales bacterium]|jgi:hypothetical protein
MIALVLAAFLLMSQPQTTPLVGLWDSTTSAGGIGTTLEFRADGTFVEATTVIVNGYYRLADGRLVIGEHPVGSNAGAGMSVQVVLEGNVLRVTGPDGAVIRKERLGGPEAAQPSIAGVWRYRHDTGLFAFERYTDNGRIFFRLPMKSSTGQYLLTGSELVLKRPGQRDILMRAVVRADQLALTTNGLTSNYQRDLAGPWYDREHIVK